MPLDFHHTDPSIESQWRAIILFGSNTATYKFAFGNALLEVAKENKTTISLEEFSPYYVNTILKHIKENDRQGTNEKSKFLDACRNHLKDEISYDQLIAITKKLGFNHVVDAFHHVNKKELVHKFYTKDFDRQKKDLVLSDNLLQLVHNSQYHNIKLEVDARWNLVETAWNINVPVNVLEVKIDDDLNEVFIESSSMRRKSITSTRNALNGYQKGKCFYSFKDISIELHHENVCAVDHFFPHLLKPYLKEMGVNVNGVWNLVLSDKKINLEKSASIPDIHYLQRLHTRNEFYISSKHPLGETIINQTGRTSAARIKFLQRVYDLSVNYAISNWKPSIELEPVF